MNRLTCQKLKAARLFYVLACSLLFLPGYSQSNLDSQLQQLNDEIRNYEKNFRTMAVSRGMTYPDRPFTAGRLKEAIARYASDLFEDPVKGFRFLFYNIKKDSLTIWVFGAKGEVEVSHASKISIDSLLILEHTIKRRISTNNLLASRQAGYDKAVVTYHISQENAAERLTKLLFPPPVLEKLSGTKYLCVLPCLNISSIPLGMLRPWQNGAELIDSMSYSFVYNLREFMDTANSGSDLTRMQAIDRYTLEEPLVVGNPAYTDSCTRGLPPLAGAEAEAIAIAKKVGTVPLTGSTVVKSDIISKMQSSTFIFLATHGYADSDDAMKKSFIALREPGGCGLLTPKEIQELHLKTNALVVLSACESGLGRTMDAGVIGIARGFLRAKAKSVVMSLWKVDDQQTRNFMMIFIEELQKPQLFFPAENFRQAVLRYRKEFSNDPAYWASFQNFGTPLRLDWENKLAAKK